MCSVIIELSYWPRSLVIEELFDIYIVAWQCLWFLVTLDSMAYRMEFLWIGSLSLVHLMCEECDRDVERWWEFGWAYLGLAYLSCVHLMGVVSLQRHLVFNICCRPTCGLNMY